MTDLEEVKKKKEYSLLPDSVIINALQKCKNDIKDTRSFLRKYFGVFLTNKVIKGKNEGILKSHISSKGRDYISFYERIFSNRKGPWTVVDLGCGVNGFSYNFMKPYGVDGYYGLEASGQIVNSTNKYFELNKINGRVYHLNLFDYDAITQLFSSIRGKKMVFLFLVIDALEGLKNDGSKVLLSKIKELIGAEDVAVLSFSLGSLSGKSRFKVNRQWLVDFLKREFKIVEDYIWGPERVIIFSKE